MQFLASLATTIVAYVLVLGVVAACSVMIMVAVQALGMRTSRLIRRLAPPNVAPRRAAVGDVAFVVAFVFTRAFTVILALDLGAIVLGTGAPTLGSVSLGLTVLTWMTGLLALTSSALASFVEGVRWSDPPGTADVKDDGPRYRPESAAA